MRQDRLPGSGLPRDRIEPFAEAQFRSLDQEKVLNPQLS
jgi:hypothetical protein